MHNKLEKNYSRNKMINKNRQLTWPNMIIIHDKNQIIYNSDSISYTRYTKIYFYPSAFSEKSF